MNLPPHRQPAEAPLIQRSVLFRRIRPPLGSGQGQLYAERFEEIGLSTQGMIRVVTDVEVLEHNATFVRASKTPGFTQYDWRIRNFRDEPPQFIGRLAIDPRMGVPAYRGGGGTNVDK